MKKIEVYEPYFFLFFGAFHLHRIWGLVDRKSYASFWVSAMENKGIFYFVLMGILAVLCILAMYDTDAWYWNVLWVSIIVLGLLVFVLGIHLLKKKNNVVASVKQ